MAWGATVACSEPEIAFDPREPARGPGQLVGSNKPLNDSFQGGASGNVEPLATDALPEAELPICTAPCQAHCSGLDLNNPVDRGVCGSLWGVGLDTRPVDRTEACRRLHADLVGYLPTRRAIQDRCPSNRPWGEIVGELIAKKHFVEINRRRWADRLLYNNEAISVERIYDIDLAVGKLYRGTLAYDEFAAVVSAHPVLTRRYDTAGDRAEALFDLFLGRPPYENERSDMARLYVLWDNGYYDHPKLGRRLPDAVIDYRCVDDDGEVDDASKGECTSVLWGYNELILKPDFRAREGQMWSGLLEPGEWNKLQLPGRIIAEREGFWEHAVDRVLKQYLGYDLGSMAPAVRQRLMEYALAHDGDIRAVHYAVATSQVYLQSSAEENATEHRWTYGPLKQIDVEPWIDTIKRTTKYPLSQCDHRIPQPSLLLDEGGFSAYSLVDHSGWEFDDEGEVVGDYRDLARTLGGCPENEVGGRFKTVSILTTATQEGFVARVCNPTLEPGEGARIGQLLPGNITADRALTPELAEEILAFQVRKFFGRNPSDDDLRLAAEGEASCAPKPCTAEAFARPVCYALLSSAEMLFY